MSSETSLLNDENLVFGKVSIAPYLLFFLILFSYRSEQFLLQGLIVSSRKDSLQHFKKPWAHEHKPVKDLLDAIKVC